MAINKRKKDGLYQLDFRPRGSVGPRIRRLCKTRREAALLQAQLQNEYDSPKPVGDDHKYRLSDLVTLWFNHHGITLKDSKYRYSRTMAVVDRLGNPFVSDFKTSDFVNYRTERLKDVSQSTVNHETRYLRAVFSELDRLGIYESSNPLSKVRTFKEDQRELSFLTEEQISIVLKECDASRNTHCGIVARICLMTGARWSEANDLPRSGLFTDAIQFSNTKNGKVRVVPIPDWLHSRILDSSFPPPYSRLFDSAKAAFRSALERSGIELPSGQMTHVLRHTFASHFVMNGGNILTLQNVLGHSDLKVTMRYAHLAPDYLKQVTDLGLGTICKI